MENAIVYEMPDKLTQANSKNHEENIKSVMDKDKDLILDFKDNEYISSAGIRVILLMHRTCEKNGHELILKNVSGALTEIFDVTGYSRFLNIKS